MKKYFIGFLFLIAFLFLIGCTNYVGDSCKENADCDTTHNCSNGVCVFSSLGGMCRTSIDCREGSCQAGVCAKSDYKGSCRSNSDCAEGLLCDQNKCVKDTTICKFGRGISSFAGYIIFLAVMLLVFGILVLIIKGRDPSGFSFKGFAVTGSFLIGAILLIIGLILYFGAYC